MNRTRKSRIKMKKPQINKLIVQSVEHSQKSAELPKIPMKVINIPNFTTPMQSIGNPSTEAINRRMMQKISTDIPFYQNPVY